MLFWPRPIILKRKTSISSSFFVSSKSYLHWPTWNKLSHSGHNREPTNTSLRIFHGCHSALLQARNVISHWHPFAPWNSRSKFSSDKAKEASQQNIQRISWLFSKVCHKRRHMGVTKNGFSIILVHVTLNRSQYLAHLAWILLFHWTHLFFSFKMRAKLFKQPSYFESYFP